MVQQVKVREEKLKQQVEELRIEIDQAKQERKFVKRLGQVQSFKTRYLHKILLVVHIFLNSKYKVCFWKTG
jgi:predicted ATP-dependent protease